MARKKGNKNRKKRNQKGRSGSKPQAPMHDRRAMEKMLADVGKLLEEQEFESIEEANAFLEQMMASGMPVARPAETPLEKAQELMYEAWDAYGKKRIKLARRALKISEDCADAYVLLAEEAARTPEEAGELYEKGVEAGERALGEEIFEEGVGHFWGILETRPYMRARAGLAQVLWFMGKRDEAIEHLQEMLRLNPGDNQGLRYTLFDWLIAAGRDEEATRLVQQYEEDIAANWAYNRALLAFRKEGATRRARKRLREALDVNPHVPAFLLGERRMPRQMPSYIGFGDENEAIEYAATGIALWSETEGALAWLRANWHEDEGSNALAGGSAGSTVPSVQFEVGDSVAIKPGERLTGPEVDVAISGWQGRVTDIDEEGQLYLLWDSDTLRQMPDWLVAKMIEEGVDWTGLIVHPETVRPAAERDKPDDWEAVARERYAEHGIDMDRIVTMSETGWSNDFAEGAIELNELFAELEIPREERELVRHCLAVGIGNYYRDLYGYEKYGPEPESLIEERAGAPYIFGYGAVEIVEHPAISTDTKLNVCLYALETMNPGREDGVPYGLLTLLGFMAAEGDLTVAVLVMSLMAAHYGSLGFFRQPFLTQGATTEAVEALVDWLVKEEELTAEEKLWVVWKVSVQFRDAAHIGKALANRWLAKEQVPADHKVELCWAWILEEDDVGETPTLWELMEAFLASDEERVRDVLRESGIDPGDAPLRLADMVPDVDGDEASEFYEFFSELRDFVITPGYLKRLAVAELVRHGEDLEEIADGLWTTETDYYGDVVNNGIADAIDEFHDQLSPETLRRLIERGVNHSRATTRKPFYELSARLYGDEFLHQALDDNAKAVRQWAKRELAKRE